MLTYRWVCVLALASVFAAGCVKAHNPDASTEASDGSTTDETDGGDANTGRLKACLYDGDTAIACSHNAQSLVVDLTPQPVGVGGTLHWKLKLISEGPGAITVNSFSATESPDFSMAPSTSDFQAVTLAASETASFDVAITPTIGGPASSTLTFQTTDPANPTFTVTLDWAVDGAALCFCLRESEGSAICKPMATLDFGKIDLGLSGRRFLRLASCGTQPVRFQKVELTNTDEVPIFSVTGLPAAGDTLEPSTAPIEAALSFAPSQGKAYVGNDGGGRLRIETSNQSFFIDLTGNGGKAGCRLAAATSILDFGQGKVGTTTQRILALSNSGAEDCTFPQTAIITQGAGVKFEVVNTPPMPLAPGQTTRVTVAYTPQDTVGPDTGELTIPFAGAPGMTGSGALAVALKGTPIAAASCKLEVQPAGSMTFGRTLDFGQVPVYATRVLPISLKNVGSAMCSISNVKIVPGLFVGTGSASDFQVKSQPTAPLAPGDTAVVDVAFTPSAPGSVSSGTLPGAYGFILTLQTNDLLFSGQECAAAPSGVATPGCIGWNLAGTGGSTELTILPSEVDFGPVTVGCQSEELSETLCNTGVAPMQVTGLTLDPVTQPPIFSMVPGTIPFTLNPGGCRTIPVRYVPPDANPHAATLFVEIKNVGITTLGIRGRGTTDFHQRDTFTQSATSKTDLLFVVDTEGSMSEEQLLLANKAQVIVDEASKAGTDFQIAVVSADMVTPGQAGLFQGTPRIIKPGVNAISQLTATLNGLGVNGSGTSQGLEAMFRALSPPLITNPAMNGGFLRSDARLAVIVVSDRFDASPGAIALYTDFLRNVKGRHTESLVSLSTIVGDASGGCTSPNGTAVAGGRYLEVQQATGGTFYSICSNDWLPLAQELGQSVFALPSAFKVSQDATANTLSVTVNGAVSPSTDWTYDATTNMVTFLPSAIPPAGATVIIDYDMMCL